MPIPFDNSYARLPDAFFAPIESTPVGAQMMIALHSREMRDGVIRDPSSAKKEVMNGKFLHCLRIPPVW